MTPLEKRGQAIFNNPGQGNCMACHTSQSGDQKPAFTDVGFRALGVPMNAMASNILSDPADHDLGLCRSGRKLPSGTEADRYCGQFKTPTLLNIERSAPYFHNGALATLEEAAWFHFTRETDPGRHGHIAGLSEDAQRRGSERVPSHCCALMQGFKNRVSRASAPRSHRP